MGDCQTPTKQYVTLKCYWIYYAKDTLFEAFPCMLLVLLCLCLALRRSTKSHFSVSSQRGNSNLQYTNTWLNQCPLLKAHKTIAEQVAFRLSDAASTKTRSSSPVTYLEIPQVLAKILPDLYHDIVVRNAVLSESLASEAFSQLQPKRQLSC